MYEGLKGWPKDPNSLTNKQAKEFFAWFLEQKPKRIEYLRSYFVETAGFYPLDVSEFSLESLWEWFKPRIGWRANTETEEELQERVRLAPERLRESMLADMRKSPFGPPDNETVAIMRDIGFYYGEVFVKKYPNVLDWRLVMKPKNDVDFHFPVVSGFYEDHSGTWNPWDVVTVLTGKAIKGISKSDDTLLGKFHYMEQWICGR